MAQIAESKWKSLQLTTDYKGEDFTASLTMGNPDFLGGTGMGILHYLQTVTPKLALGAELAYQAAPQIPGNGKDKIKANILGLMPNCSRWPHWRVIGGGHGGGALLAL